MKSTLQSIRSCAKKFLSIFCTDAINFICILSVIPNHRQLGLGNIANILHDTFEFPACLKKYISHLLAKFLLSLNNWILQFSVILINEINPKAEMPGVVPGIILEKLEFKKSYQINKQLPIIVRKKLRKTGSKTRWIRI